MSVPCGSAPSSPTATSPPLAFVLTDSVTFVAEKRLTGGRGHCEILEGRLHVTEGGVTTTRHAVIMKSAARGDPQRRDSERTAEHLDRQWNESLRGVNMEAEGQWAYYINSFATAAQGQDHQHQYNRLPETHTGTAHIVPQVHIRSNRQPEEPQTEGQGHFGDHYAVFDKVGNGKELEDVIFDSTCGSDDYRAVVGVNALLCMLELHALGVTHNDYHYGNLLVADEATGELKVTDLESLRKVLRARHPTAPCREDGTPGPQPPTGLPPLQSHPAPLHLSLHHLQTWARGDYGYDIKEVNDYTPATFAVLLLSFDGPTAGHLRHFATDKLRAVLHHFSHLAEADLGDEAARRAVGMYQRAVADIRQEARRLSTTERQERAVALGRVLQQRRQGPATKALGAQAAERTAHPAPGGSTMDDADYEKCGLTGTSLPTFYIP
ncbi:unnamed protein product [Vitrella brassicaformis CCMP3155]|uniref:Protein kinase domain-containing protein n=1 Tax=Vitrella brassicaformis (strain CCMP3155) TaxID=1169540 RepID=A0A0G4FZX7_VITBC|nr:unnamed protein product [Vitrella brassicaformis CCMP3155]|eukprot:CEM20951.1 unnamed protein product [Vitrella brassicaformis CCMP3155]